MSIISASTLTSTALQYTADTTGTLVFKTGATPTTALTLNADQSATFAGTVNFATAAFTNLSYTGTLTGGTGVVNLGSGQFYKDSSGNIGLGTTSPIGQLHVTSTAGTSVVSAITSSAGNVARFQLIGPTANYGWFVPDNANYLSLYDYNASAERMQISSTGNVAIGAGSAGQKLVVAGGVGIYGPATLAASVGAGLFSYETPVMRYYVGDGTGYSWAFSKRVSSTTTDLMSILDNGYVGIGTSSPVARLTVAGGVVLSGGAGQGNAFYPYFNSATSYNAIASDINGGMTFITGVTAPAIRATLDNTGYLRLTTSSGGIQFNGDTSSANALNDYEEGTWTPTTPTAGVTITGITGAYYVKVGKFVLAYAYFTVSCPGGTVAAVWSGLPYAALSYAPASRYYGPSSFSESSYVESGSAYIIDNNDIPVGTQGIMISAYYRTT